jgi:hypothetical protein
MKSKKNIKPQLRLMASSWTFTNYPSKAAEWSPEKKAKAIKAAGFDGIATRPNNAIFEHGKRLGLPFIGNLDIGSVQEVEPALQEYKKADMVHINVQLCDHDTPTAKALPIAIKVIQVGDRLGLKPAIEMHRDTCTETPEKAYALADAYKKKTGKMLRMNFDHSHPAIVKHIYPHTYWPRLGVRLELLRYSEMIHFRPFNGHHCQIPITDGRGGLSKEFTSWIPFCEKVIEAWLAKAKPGAEFYVVPELGPRGGYCLSCFPDVWKDTQVLAAEIRKVWNRAVRKWKP